MDFSNRNAQPQAAPTAPQAAGPSGGSKKNKSSSKNWGRIGSVAAVAAVVILLVSLIAAVSLGGNTSAEEKYVDSSKLQAVFLNTGQVYFGKVKELNSKYFVVSNIYYLQTSGGTGTDAAKTNTSVSLVKLGCELHEPYDQMVINRDQVTFWENLQDNGQVAQAVKTFVKQNPSGQKCADQSSSAGTSSTNNVQSAGSNNGSTTPAKP
ncbi:MAG: hypothetical protein JWO35_202 [Candidatus Saccharibacteria bacterium]|nr:hypothetical protein [Candidatus Saccharibacteria bacterium]